MSLSKLLSPKTMERNSLSGVSLPFPQETKTKTQARHRYASYRDSVLPICESLNEKESMGMKEKKASTSPIHMRSKMVRMKNQHIVEHGISCIRSGMGLAMDVNKYSKTNNENSPQTHAETRR